MPTPPISSGAARARVALAAFVALSWSQGCRAPALVTPLPRQWIEVAVGPVQRDEPGSPELEEDFAYGVGGGYDVLSIEHLRAGFELGFDWGRFDLEPEPASGEESLDGWTWQVGGRLQFDAWPAPFGAHLRAGGFWRDWEDFAGSGATDDQGGAYAGAGLDWWFRPDMALSFFALHRRGSDDLDETQFGLSARFHFAPEPDPSQEPDWWW